MVVNETAEYKEIRLAKSSGVASRSSTRGELLKCRPPPGEYILAVRRVNLGGSEACPTCRGETSPFSLGGRVELLC